MTWTESVPLLTLLTSLVPAAIIFLLREEHVRARTAVNLAGATIKLVLIGVMLWGVVRELHYEFRVPVLPGADFVLQADALAMFFVTLSGLLWFLTTVYAIAYLEGSPHRRRFFGFFSLCVSATVGIALAGNLFTFVTFYELLTITTYPLVVHRQSEVSLRAGAVYLIYTLAGGASLLAGAVWLHALVPTVDFSKGAALIALGGEYDGTLRLIFALLVAGLGVKAALVPLHGWLPRAMVAPAPVSALLHAVAVVKAGAFGIARIVYDVFGIDRAHALGVMLPLALWAAATIVYGSLRALFQDDLKRRLAFSTVSQVSYIALGVALLGPSSTVGGMVHLVHQGLMKITLFFCAGNLAETLNIKKISQMHGVGRRMPWTMGAFTVAALGMIGVPPVCGFVSKWYLGFGAVEAEQYWVLLILAASSMLNAAYFLPVLYQAWFRDPTSPWEESPRRTKLETSWELLVPPLLTAAFALGTGLLAGAPLSPLQWVVLIVGRAYGRAVIDRGLGGPQALVTPERVLLLLPVVAPLAAAILLSRARRGGVSWLVPLAALPALVLALYAPLSMRVDLLWFLLHMHVGMDPTGQAFLLFTALLWLVAGIYARGYLTEDSRATRFCLFYLLAMAGNLGLAISQDMASFYLFFALMSFASYPLVIYHRDDAALRAGRVYMVLVILGETALMAGMLLAAVARESLLFNAASAPAAPEFVTHATGALLLVGLGIKAGLVPLHMWLPLAHPAAPTPASAVLSGAMIKAGLLGWLRFLPPGEPGMASWGVAGIVLGLVTAFYGVCVGVTQQDAKAVLAYSSVSQMGLITLGLAGGFLLPQAWPAVWAAVLLYALHHGLTKGCLFLSVGVAPGAAGRALLGRVLRWVLVIPPLVMAGAPLTIGAASKGAIKYALADLPFPWHDVFEVLFPLASVGTALVMARFLYLIWPRTEAAAEHPTALMYTAWALLLGSVLAAAWFIPAHIASDHGVRLLANTMSWTNSWPIPLAIVIAWSAWWLATHGHVTRLPVIPPGDLLGPIQRVYRFLAAAVGHLGHRSLLRRARSGGVRPSYAALRRLHSVLRAGEAITGSWPWVAACLAVVAAACCLRWFF